MPRVKIEDLREGMVVAKDVKNIDEMLLIPSDTTLTARQISILQAWGVSEIEVEACDSVTDGDPLAKLSPEALEKMAAEIKAQFWQTDEFNPVFAEVFRLMLQRRARKRD